MPNATDKQSMLHDLTTENMIHLSKETYIQHLSSM